MKRKLINFQEALDRYGFKAWGLRWMIRKRSIPHVRIGRRIYFDLEKTDSWVDKHSVDPEPSN